MHVCVAVCCSVSLEASRMDACACYSVLQCVTRIMTDAYVWALEGGDSTLCAVIPWCVQCCSVLQCCSHVRRNHTMFPCVCCSVLQYVTRVTCRTWIVRLCDAMCATWLLRLCDATPSLELLVCVGIMHVVGVASRMHMCDSTAHAVSEGPPPE